ncbi:MAG: class I tRNA ligase family protein [Bacillus subtilis]|nr:class I tRNA ligase family protein [Bacillus subtilis]
MVEQFEPTDTGESPLSHIDSFVRCSVPEVRRSRARRETDTMPQWAGSCWYFLRYMDPKNPDAIRRPRTSWTIGMPRRLVQRRDGARHAAICIYCRGSGTSSSTTSASCRTAEPYKKRTAQGLILGADGEKMSQVAAATSSTPIDIIEEYGADTLRTFILFIGDYELADAVERLERPERLPPLPRPGLAASRRSSSPPTPTTPALDNLILRTTIKGVGDDLRGDEVQHRHRQDDDPRRTSAAAAERDHPEADLRDDDPSAPANPIAPHVMQRDLWRSARLPWDDALRPIRWPTLRRRNAISPTTSSRSS